VQKQALAVLLIPACYLSAAKQNRANLEFAPQVPTSHTAPSVRQMHKLVGVLFFVVFFFFVPVQSYRSLPGNWTLTWYDEFDGPDGSKPSEDKVRFSKKKTAPGPMFARVALCLGYFKARLGNDYAGLFAFTRNERLTPFAQSGQLPINFTTLETMNFSYTPKIMCTFRMASLF
jgi:hypothetical protein